MENKNNGLKFGSNEYTPTPSHTLPAFRGGIIRGYVCPACGHLTIDEDEILGLACPKCFQKWAQEHITQMITVKEAVEKDKEKDIALEPTKRYSPGTQEFKHATTVIIKNKKKEAEKLNIDPSITKPKPKPPLKKRLTTSFAKYTKGWLYYIRSLF